MPVTAVFDPAKDGWYFSNWGETGAHCIGSCDFEWDLYRKVYLGINPNHDCAEAPLDCAFYEIFKGCAAQGNCGGMSLLGLAIFKYGGYMGFCSPANFYTGTVAPDREDLHRAINIFQARQFSAPGIQNFIDVVAAGQLNNADAAFKKIKAELGNGDYAVLSLATGMFGDNAHTVIPYAVDESSSGTKLIRVWDPNYPYDDYAGYYTSGNNRLTIHSAFDWEYKQGFGTSKPGYEYKGTNNGWCFAVPMSVVLHKARHPMTLDILFDALTTAFLHGPGAAITQIEDDEGHRFYAADTDAHMGRSEIETSPVHGMPWAVRWPWYAAAPLGQPPGELYFLRRPPGVGALKLTLRGSDYTLLHSQAGNLVQVAARGGARARDTLTITGLSGDAQSLELHTSGAKRSYTVQQLRSFARDGGWRAINLSNARLSAGGLHVQTLGDLQVAQVTGVERHVAFELELQQYRQKELVKRPLGRHTTSAERTVHFAPHDWDNLQHTRVDTKSFRRAARERR